MYCCNGVVVAVNATMTNDHYANSKPNSILIRKIKTYSVTVTSSQSQHASVILQCQLLCHCDILHTVCQLPLSHVPSSYSILSPRPTEVLQASVKLRLYVACISCTVVSLIDCVCDVLSIDLACQATRAPPY